MQAGYDSTQFLVFLVVGLVIGGTVGYAIGASKGRPGLGVVLGALFGLLGWIIVAVLPRPKDPASRPQGPSRGWYPDPTHAHELRYFDGNKWMADVADRGEMSVDPLPPVPVASQ